MTLPKTDSTDSLSSGLCSVEIGHKRLYSNYNRICNLRGEICNTKGMRGQNEPLEENISVRKILRQKNIELQNCETSKNFMNLSEPTHRKIKI